MQIRTRGALRLALITALTVSAAACASKPAYQPTPTAQTPQAPQNTSPPTQPAMPATPTQPMSSAPLPGSTQDFVVNVGDRIYFDFDSYDVRADARPVLDAQAAWLQRYPNVMVRLEGNADERGTREYNFALGARRANAVRDYLVSRGVANGRIETVSYGKERPANPGTDDAAYAENRNARTTLTSGAR